eukprot:scaffold17066_cov33-Phaeocystis_antarctica.AAC.1
MWGAVMWREAVAVAAAVQQQLRRPTATTRRRRRRRAPRVSARRLARPLPPRHARPRGRVSPK